MKRFWARRTDGRTIDVAKAIDRHEYPFASDRLGEIDSRYALELVIDLLSREDGARSGESRVGYGPGLGQLTRS